MDQQIKDDIEEYLKHSNNNQIKGFYNFSGYWSRDKKDKALASLSARNKENLKEIYGYMMSITEKDIEEMIISYYTDWLNKYGNVGRSNNEKEAKKLIEYPGDTAKLNFNILKRVRFFVGCSIGYYNKDEVLSWIKEIKGEEVNDTFWKDKDTRLSNCIFSLSILKSYLEGSPYEAFVNEELKNLAKVRLELNGVNKEIEIGNLSLYDISELIKMSEMKNHV